MSAYGLTVTIHLPFADAVEATRAALAEQGFGVLTEIDVAATMRIKLDADLPPHLILGACNPPLALQAIQAEPSIGLLLPCNVVVRAAGGETTVIEAMDPRIMVRVTGNDRLRAVADDARQRLQAALDRLAQSPTTR
jgi:uncharacterized protein (DUF302 family)